MKKLLFIFVLCICVLTITGCGNSSTKKSIDPEIIGTWNYSEEGIQAIYVLKKDGTGSYNITVEGNTVVKGVDYYTKNGVLYINYDKDKDTYELEYSIKDNQLIIVDSTGADVIYNKK